jgi:hypothetical protein
MNCRIYSRGTCELLFQIMLLQVFSDYYERVVEFLPVGLWYLDEENSASYTLSGDVQPTLWDWVGVFKVLVCSAFSYCNNSSETEIRNFYDYHTEASKMIF